MMTALKALLTGILCLLLLALLAGIVFLASLFLGFELKSLIMPLVVLAALVVLFFAGRRLWLYLAGRRFRKTVLATDTRKVASQVVDEANANAMEEACRAGLAHAKSRNIKAMSAIVAENGIPETMEGLQRLPGVGEKTAACYYSGILGGNAVIADIHFVRVAKRLGFTDTDDRTASAREIRERFPEELWTRISMVLNLHGRECCRPKPDCARCPVGSICPSSADDGR